VGKRVVLGIVKVYKIYRFKVLM